jgi:hypothetical protein
MSNDGVTDRKEASAAIHRIELTLNRYGVSRALRLAGLIPEGYHLKDVGFPDAHNSDEPALNALVLFALEREIPS